MSLEKEILSIVKGASKRDSGTQPYDTVAKVVRIEKDTAWVHIDGGVSETPVRLTINAKVGDSVQVRVSGGSAWITGNTSAPPTDDAVALVADSKATDAKESANNAMVTAVEAESVATTAKAQAVEAKTIADDTAQYFWYADEGTDTGAHITEVPQDDFIADPANGGGNLLARSNGIAVRDGLNEMAIFGTNGMQVGQTLVTPQVVIGQTNISMRTDEGATFFSIDGTNSSAQSEAVVASQSDFRLFEDTHSTTLVGAIQTGANVSLSGLWYEWGAPFDVESFTLGTAVNGTASSTSSKITLSADDMTFTFGTAETKTASVPLDYTTASETGTFVLAITVAYDGVRTIDFTMSASHTVGSELVFVIGQTGHYNDIISTVSDVKAPAFTLGTRTGDLGALSLTAGTSLYAENGNEVALGQYNTNGNYALVVGNGTNDTNRSNAFTVDWNGNLVVAGDVTNGSGQKLSDLGASMFEVSSVTTENISLNANAAFSGAIMATKTGYYPIAIVGWATNYVTGQVTARSMHTLFLSSQSVGSATITYGIRNNFSASNNGSHTFYILWIKA